MPKITRNHAVLIAVFVVMVAFSWWMLRVPTPAIENTDPVNSPPALNTSSSDTDLEFDDLDSMDSDADLNEESAPIDASMRYAFQGRIVTQNSRIIPDALMAIDGPVQASAQSDHEGRFAIPDLPSGRYTVRVTHPLFPDYQSTMTIRSNQPIDLKLENIEVRGQVSGARIDIPIEKLTIGWVAMNEPENTPAHRRDFHRTSGAFSLEYIDHKFNAISVYAQGYETKIVQLTDFTRTDAALEAAIQLEPEEGIEGRVVNEQGDAIEHARIFMETRHSGKNEDGEINVVTYSDADGRFRVRKPTEAANYIIAEHDDYGPGYSIYSDRDPWKTHTITLVRGATLEGRVTFDGRPLLRQLIRLKYLVDEAFGEREAVTDAQGRYAIHGLPAGDVVVHLRGVDLHEQNVSISDAQITALATITYAATTTQDFELPATTGSLEGRITVNGTPPKDSELYLDIEGKTGRVRYRGSIDEHGYYTFDNVQAGYGEFMIGPEYNNTVRLITEPVTVHAGVTTVHDIDLKLGTGSITGTLDVRGELIMFLYDTHSGIDATRYFSDLKKLMDLEMVPEGVKALAMYFFDQPDPDGLRRYRFDHLDDGDYTLAATNEIDTPIMLNIDRTAIQIEQVSIVNGESAVVNFKF